MQRRAMIGIGIVIVIVAGAVGVLWLNRAPPLSSVGAPSGGECIASADACPHFPAISGENLPGETFDLPADFAGAWTLVIVPFDEEQQTSASDWLPLARELAVDYPDFTYYNVPVFPGMGAPLRAIIRTGMNLTIPDAELRALTITAFLDDRDAFLGALDIPNTDEMQILLLNPTREVVWRGMGNYTREQGESLRAALAVNDASD